MVDRTARGFLFLTLLLGFIPATSAQEYKRSSDPPALLVSIQGLHVNNDRWPDAYSLPSFALDAIRLDHAGTQEEEAIALYNWIARVMTIGGSPYEGPPGKESPVLDTLKIMAIYGNHWCDGQARLLETMWRSLGRQGCRLYIPMRHHSFVELKWRDADGEERWHALDVNNGWFVRNGQGWIASSEDIERDPLLVLSANQDLKMRTKGWLRTHLSAMPEHSMALHLRKGESCTLLWESGGHFYVNPRTRASVSSESPLYKAGGPYSEFIGCGEMVLVPDLGNPAWTGDLRDEPENLVVSSGRLQPKLTGRVSSLTYGFDYPYLISDAIIEGTLNNANPKASAAVSFSTDGGNSWQKAWSTSALGETRLNLNLGAERDREGAPSVAGLYSYLVRFELQAQADPAEITLKELRFFHRTMMNRMTLPNLQPGWNRFRIAAQSMAADCALKISLEWTDKNGRQRIEKSTRSLPYDFDVFANCSGGAAIKMHSLRLQAIQTAEDLAPARPRLERIIEAGLNRDVSAVEGLTEALKDADPEVRYWAADALGKIGSPSAIPPLIRSLRDPLDAVRMSACVALGDLKAAEALPDLINLVAGKTPPGKGYSLFIPEDVGAVRWMAARALGRIGDPGAVLPLVDALGSAGGDLGGYIAEALGELGDKRAVPALIEAAGQREEPALRSVAEALGGLGDSRAVPVLLELLNTGKEDARYAAAVALGHLHDPRAAPDLRKVSQNDPQEYVRRAALRALEELAGGGKK